MKDAINKIQNLTYGCELEYEGISRETAAKTVAAVVGGTARYVGAHLGNWEVTMPDGRVWQVETDGSLAGNSAETVTPILTYKDMPMLQNVVRALRRAGAQWSERTGLHVHVGVKDCTPEQIKNLVRIFYKQEELILKAAGTLERRIARYTRKTDHSFLANIERLKGDKLTMDNLNIAWFGYYTPNPYHYDDHHYHALNLNNLWGRGAKHTVEFRFFNGTTHAGKIRADVLLALTLVAFAKEAKTSSAKDPREYNEASAKYDFRVFLLRLGWIGDVFTEPRKHLLANLPGSAAWKNGTGHGRTVAAVAA